jgi:hypothetical protein
MTTNEDWAFERPAKITVRDAEGTITYMNRAAFAGLAEIVIPFADDLPRRVRD